MINLARVRIRNILPIIIMRTPTFQTYIREAQNIKDTEALFSIVQSTHGHVLMTTLSFATKM